MNTNRGGKELLQLTHNKTIAEESISMNTSIEVSQVIFTLKPMSYKKIKEILNFGDVREEIKISFLDKLS